jgi:hypothetical protein
MSSEQALLVRDAPKDMGDFIRRPVVDGDAESFGLLVFDPVTD